MEVRVFCISLADASSAGLLPTLQQWEELMFAEARGA